MRDQKPKLFGEIISVSESAIGDFLATNASATDTVLSLTDATPFNESGGSLTISDDTNSETVDFTAVDMDADTVTLGSALANSYDKDDSTVTVFPDNNKRYANTAITGGEDDTIVALVPSQMSAYLPLGTRNDDERERAVLEWEYESGNWVVRDLYLADIEDSQLVLSLYQLDDVSSTADVDAANGDVLTWDASNGEWIPSASSGGGDIAESYFLGGP